MRFILKIFSPCSDTTPPIGDSKEFWVNMSNLLSHLKKVAEQRPQATYYNVDMLKYQVRFYIWAWSVSIYISEIRTWSSSRMFVVVCDIWDLGSQVSTQGIQSTPLNLAVSWRGDASSTDLRIDYKYNTEAMAIPTPLTNIHFMAAVDGGVNKLQAMLPPATWWGSVKKITLQINSSVVLYSDVCPFVAF